MNVRKNRTMWHWCVSRSSKAVVIFASPNA
jgi:hypothetical protein